MREIALHWEKKLVSINTEKKGFTKRPPLTHPPRRIENISKVSISNGGFGHSAFLSRVCHVEKNDISIVTICNFDCDITCQCQLVTIIGPTWLSFSQGNLWCPVHETVHTKKIINQGANGPLLWLESDGLSWGTLGHPQSPIKKSDPPGCPGLERVVQSISLIGWLTFSNCKETKASGFFAAFLDLPPIWLPPYPVIWVAPLIAVIVLFSLLVSVGVVGCPLVTKNNNYLHSASFNGWGSFK